MYGADAGSSNILKRRVFEWLGKEERGWTMFERIANWVAWHLPRRIVYHCAVRLMVHGTVGKWKEQVVPELNAMDALERWNDTEEDDVAGNTEVAVA